MPAFTDFDKVWVNVQGISWWPAIILPLEDLPQDLQRAKPKNRDVLSAHVIYHGCFFYGTREYGWFPESEMEGFDENFYKNGYFFPKFFIQALDEATDPRFRVPRTSVSSQLNEEKEVVNTSSNVKRKSAGSEELEQNEIDPRQTTGQRDAEDNGVNTPEVIRNRKNKGKKRSRHIIEDTDEEENTTTLGVGESSNAVNMSFSQNHVQCETEISQMENIGLQLELVKLDARKLGVKRRKLALDRKKAQMARNRYKLRLKG